MVTTDWPAIITIALAGGYSIVKIRREMNMWLKNEAAKRRLILMGYTVEDSGSGRVKVYRMRK